MQNVIGESMSKPLDLVLGRRTYEIFAAHWPHTDDPGAEPLNKATKARGVEDADGARVAALLQQTVGVARVGAEPTISLLERVVAQFSGSPTALRIGIDILLTHAFPGATRKPLEGLLHRTRHNH